MGPELAYLLFDYMTFQSTHPVWDGTPCNQLAPEIIPYFNPLTPCGVRLGFAGSDTTPNSFQSTHPVWGETINGNAEVALDEFQSTHPVWGETSPPLSVLIDPRISIHSPRVG